MVAAFTTFARSQAVRALGLTFAAAFLAACSGVDASVDRAERATETSAAVPAPAVKDVTAPSTQESRASACSAQAQKQCLERTELAACEERLSVYSEGYVRALAQCVDRLATCDARSSMYSCELEALEAVAPGFPDLPLITRCKTKNRSCATAYPRDSRWKSQVDSACEALVGLGEPARARGEACIEAQQGCNQFAECVSGLY